MSKLRNFIAGVRGNLLSWSNPKLRSSAGVRIFARGRIEIRRGGAVTIGARTRIGRGSTLVVSGDLSIGEDVYFNEFAHLSCVKSVTIGDRVRFGERVSIHDENHVFEPIPLSADEREAYNSDKVEVGDDVWIGANVTILSGVSIGDGSVIAAGSVVNKDIPRGVLAGGVPVRILRQLRRREGRGV